MLLVSKTRAVQSTVLSILSSNSCSALLSAHLSDIHHLTKTSNAPPQQSTMSLNPERSFQLIIYAKSPIDKRVKTRLARASNTRFATQAYKRLLQKTLASMSGLENVCLACSPNLRHGYIRQLTTHYGVKLIAQPLGNLGQRMAKSMRKGCPTNPCIIIGTDCPELAAQDITDAVEALRNTDAYLLPAFDGGYALIACNRYHPALFRQVSWSTPRLLAQTQRQARAAGIRLKTGRVVSDVDQYPEWKKARKLKQAPALWKRRFPNNTN